MIKVDGKDEYRNDMISFKYDYNRMDDKYLPKKKLKKYAYNQTTEENLRQQPRLYRVVPGGGNPKAYNSELDDAFIEVIFF